MLREKHLRRTCTSFLITPTWQSEAIAFKVGGGLLVQNSDFGFAVANDRPKHLIGRPVIPLWKEQPLDAAFDEMIYKLRNVLNAVPVDYSLR